MGFLQDSRCYLAGPVEHDKTCEGWRITIANQLKEMGVVTYDPLVKPSWFSEVSRMDPSIYLKIINGGSSPNLGVSDVFNALIEMREACLRIVSVVDWVICYHPKKFTVGTIDEVLETHRFGKPVFYCGPDGVLSTWLMVVASEADTYDRVFFKDWESLLEHVRRIDSGEAAIDPHQWPGLTWHS